MLDIISLLSSNFGTATKPEKARERSEDFDALLARDSKTEPKRDVARNDISPDKARSKNITAQSERDDTNVKDTPAATDAADAPKQAAAENAEPDQEKNQDAPAQDAAQTAKTDNNPSDKPKAADDAVALAQPLLPPTLSEDSKATSSAFPQVDDVAVTLAATTSTAPTSDAAADAATLAAQTALAAAATKDTAKAEGEKPSGKALAEKTATIVNTQSKAVAALLGDGEEKNTDKLSAGNKKDGETKTEQRASPNALAQLQPQTPPPPPPQNNDAAQIQLQQAMQPKAELQKMQAANNAAPEHKPQLTVTEAQKPQLYEQTSQLSGATRAGRPAQLPHIPEQVAVALHKAIRNGEDTLTLQLKPADLGKIEVKLEFAADGRVRATVMADNAVTLDMMQKDARGLERALQEAGLRTDAGSLSFNLREQNQRQTQNDGDDSRAGFGRFSTGNDNIDDGAAELAHIATRYVAPGRIDVQV